jgi:hypothetical protein
LPILDEMQNLLSQRGADHADADECLPEWSVWWNAFRMKNQLNVSFRTVQDRLRGYRGRSSGEKRSKPRVTRSEQQQLTVTATLAYRLAAAIQSGEGIREALDTFLRDSLPLHLVDEIGNRIGTVRHFNSLRQVPKPKSDGKNEFAAA